MNHYPAWKNLLIALVVAVGILIALPNIFGKGPSVQLSFFLSIHLPFPPYLFHI